MKDISTIQKAGRTLLKEFDPFNPSDMIKRLKVLKNLYEKDNEKWVKEYVNSLSSLSDIYFEEGGYTYEDMIELEERARSILQPFYEKDNDKWKEEYMKVLNNLTEYYYQKYHSDEYIASQEGKEFIYNHPTKHFRLAEESIKIIRSLYDKDNVKWREQYLLSLNSLAKYCNESDSSDAGIALMKKA
jgi:hypothetical protein